jgi:uncharacterized protein YjbI with pentapeptide repeats
MLKGATIDWLGNVIFRNGEIQGERLELTDKKANYILGPNLTLRNCTLVTRVTGRNLSLHPTRFIDCTFEVKQELLNFQQWISVSLKGCRFKGRFRGNDFGHWPEYGSQPEYQFGSLEDCDFSEARLDNCRFHDCDLRTLRLPRWPCFTLMEPLRHACELQSAQWPGWFGRVTVNHLQKHNSPSTVALTFYAPSAARFYETTEEELKAAIERFDCFYY